MSGKNPAFLFYPSDWIQDTRILTPITRGIWIDMLCFMWRSPERGKLEMTYQQFARVLSCTEQEIETAINELSVTCNANVTKCNKNVTVINRRMYREEKERKSTRYRVAEFRKRKSNTSVTPASSVSVSVSVSKEEKKEEKKEENTFCSEVEKTLPTEPEEIFITLTLNDKTEYTITETVIKELSELYPAVDVKQEFRGMKGWLNADTKRRKTKTGIKRFYTGWLSRAQNRGKSDGISKQQNNEPEMKVFR